MIEGLGALILALATWIVKRAVNKNTDAKEAAADRNAADHQRVINALAWTQQAVIENTTKLDTFIIEHDKAHKIIDERLNQR